MLLQFVNVLLQALVYRSHDLLQEEITITLYNMAAVDFESFYSLFLPQFLGGCEGLTDSQKSELGKNFSSDKVGVQHISELSQNLFISLNHKYDQLDFDVINQTQGRVFHHQEECFIRYPNTEK